MIDKFSREIKRDMFLVWASNNNQNLGQVLGFTHSGMPIVLKYAQDRHEEGLEPQRVTVRRPEQSIATTDWPLSGESHIYLRKHTI